MSTLLKLLKSKTVWATLINVAINTLPQVQDLIPPEYQPAATAVLGALAVYGRAKPKQQF